MLLEVVVYKVSKACKVSKETVVSVDILVSKVFKVLQVKKVKQLLAQLVHKDKKVLVVYKVNKVW